jgi:pyruvate, water dikinase
MPGGHVAQILWFENYQLADAPVLGGKNASLGALLAAGLPVPPGFAVSAECYRKALADGGLTGQLDVLIAAVDPHDPASVAAAGARARALIGSLVMPGDLADAIRAAYAELCSRCGDSHVPVAVRSSATCEDQPDASFAGEHDTYLWVRGGDSVVAHVLRCWASLFTDRCPQDVEWAIDAFTGDVVLLQSRPETVWSRRPRPAASCTADPITSMVQTLLNPSHGTPEGHGHG